MRTRVIRRTALIGLMTLTLIGCGRQDAKTPEGGSDLLAIGPDQAALAAVRPDYILAAVEAAGGLPAWMQCKQLERRGIVTTYRPDNSYYLTEHTFAVYPWSEAIRISAREPRTPFLWQMVRGQYEPLEGNASLDVSPLAGVYQNYAAAVQQVVTAPARLLDRGTQLTRRPLAVQIRGQEYDLVEARFAARKTEAGDKKETPTTVEPYWTNGIYFQNRQSSRIEMIWLANPARQNFLVVRGYDYAAVARDGVSIPTKIEIFRSDPEGGIGPRFAKIDLVM